MTNQKCGQPFADYHMVINDCHTDWGLSFHFVFLLLQRHRFRAIVVSFDRLFWSKLPLMMYALAPASIPLAIGMRVKRSHQDDGSSVSFSSANSRRKLKAIHQRHFYVRHDEVKGLRKAFSASTPLVAVRTP